MPRIFVVAILFWGWAYLLVRHLFPPVQLVGTISGGVVDFFIAATFFFWIVFSTATKLFIVLDVFKKTWFDILFSAVLCWAVFMIVSFAHGPTGITQDFFWYHKLLGFGLFFVWPVFDIGLCLGIRRFRNRDN